MQADTPIVVQFDRAVVPATLAGRVRVQPSIDGCDLTAAFTDPLATSCRAVWTSGDTAFVLQHPRAIFGPLTTYHFTVAAGVSSPEGTVNDVDHSWDITTGSAPVVRSIAPPDGSRGVPVDTVVTIAFSGGMSPSVTDRAIRLDPPVPGARVVRNRLDASRFVLFPGQLLRPGTTYRVTVARTAADQHHQTLAAPVQTSFTTGLLSASGHAVVLAARSGEAPTQVVITSLAATEAGEPVPAVVALEAPRCTEPSGCGTVPLGHPLAAYVAAELAPGGRWLAVVEQDLALPAAAPTLRVIDVARGTTLAGIPQGTLPSWSPDGSVLAYASGGGVALFSPGSSATRTLPPGDPLLAAPVWSPNGEVLALTVGPAAAAPAIELGDAVAGARYPLPGLPGPCQRPAFSPDGTQLALECAPADAAAQGTWLAPVTGGASGARLLDARLTPAGFAGGGILLAVSHTPEGSAQLLRVAVDSDDQSGLARQVPSSALDSVVVSASLRRFAFLAPDQRGAVQAYVENSDGSQALPITAFGDGLQATAVTLSG